VIKYKDWLIKTVILFTVAVTAILVISFFSIFRGVRSACIKAKVIYQLDCTGSLIEFIKFDKYSFRERNTAIWALGQLADKRALSYLEELNRTVPDSHKCSYDKSLCKYEIEKAIKWTVNGNMTSWMYRNQNNW
jgi:hypothetical protein